MSIRALLRAPQTPRLRGLRMVRSLLVAGAIAAGAVAPSANAGTDPAAPASGSRILWDTSGVAHIEANDDVAGFRAFGWAQLEAHGDRILELYGYARGEAAEHWGEKAAAADELTRRLGFPALAARWQAALPAQARARLDAFVAGMNAFANAHPERLSPAMRAVLPVRGTDPLAHLYQVIHATFIAGEDIATAQGLTSNSAPLPAGSNGYAVAPSRSASGNAMLVINPHLPWSGLFTWFETQLRLPSQSIYGVALVGAPFVGIGFNEVGGWTHTVNDYDGADLYRLTLKDGGYQLDGVHKPFARRTETFRVRRSDGTLEQRELEILESEHGPVIARRDGVAYALRLAGLKSYGMLEQYWDMAAAPDLERFEAAQSRLQMPFFNTIYANRAGHIAYSFGGSLPDRRIGDHAYWRGVLPGDRSELIWQGELGADALPHFRDPPAGFIQNANDPPWTTTEPAVLKPGDWPMVLAPREGMAFRPQHSMRQMLANPSVSFDALVAMKQSTRLELADRILPSLLLAAASSSDPDVVEARDVLARWDRKTDAHSRGALLFVAWASRFRAAGSAGFATQWRPDRPYDTPAGLADPSAAVAMLAAAANEIRQRFSALDAPYGQGVRLRLGGKDLPASGGPDELGAYRTTFGTPDAQGVVDVIGGDSFAAIVEFGPRLRAVGILPYGASSQPGSPHAGDQLKLFSDGQLRTIWFYPEDVRAHVERIEHVR